MTEIVKHQPKPNPTRQLVGLAARRKAALEKAALEEASAPKPPVDTTPLFDSPDKMPDRIGIVFDDSGSMASNNAIGDAHTGCEEFMRSSNPKTTAVAVYPMNAEPIVLSLNLPQVAKDIKSIRATGGTPALATLESMNDAEKLTRSIMFSDGSFGMWEWPELLTKLKAKEMVVDTVYIGASDKDGGAMNLKKIAEDTGGIFLHFQPGKTSFSRAFKYLSPGLRKMLMDKSFKEKVERGEV